MDSLSLFSLLLKPIKDVLLNLFLIHCTYIKGYLRYRCARKEQSLLFDQSLIGFFCSEKTYIHHTCDTRFELPYNISTMLLLITKLSLITKNESMDTSQIIRLTNKINFFLLSKQKRKKSNCVIKLFSLSRYFIDNLRLQ